MSLWHRLRERKLVQWAAAYVATAWVVLQVVDVVADQWSWSLGLQRGIGVLLAAGLLVTIVIAWQHGERGRQRVSPVEVVLLTILLGLGGVGAFWVARQAPDATEVSETLPRSEDPRPALVALPWANLSDSAQDAWFADGVRDEILSRLARLSGLRVVSRTSALAYRDTDKPMPLIAEELRASFVLEGGLLRAGEDVQVRVALYDGPRDAQLWQETFVEALTVENLFEIQATIASRVAAELEATLSPSEARELSAPSTGDLSALELYYLGRELWRQRDEPGLSRAIGLFERATARDPDFARAWAGLADALAVHHFHYVRPADDSFERAIEAARRAIELDPGLAEAHASLAFALMYGRWDWEGAATAFARSIELDPEYPVAHYWRCELEAIVGRVEDALAACRQAVAVDPRSATARNVLSWPLGALGLYEEAIEQAEIARDLAPDWVAPYNNLALMYTLLGDSARVVETSRPHPDALAFARLLASRGDPAALVRDVERGLGRPDAAFAAGLFAIRGERDSAFSRLARGLDERHPQLPLLFAWPIRGLLMPDPRIAELQRRMGLDPW